MSDIEDRTEARLQELDALYKMETEIAARQAEAERAAGVAPEASIPRFSEDIESKDISLTVHVHAGGVYVESWEDVVAGVLDAD